MKIEHTKDNKARNENNDNNDKKDENKPVRNYLQSYVKNLKEVNFIFNHIPKDESFIGQQNLLLAQELKAIYFYEYSKYMVYGISFTYFFMMFNDKYNLLRKLKIPMMFMIPSAFSINFI